MNRNRSDWYALHVTGLTNVAENQASGPLRWIRRFGLDPFVPTERKIMFARRHHAQIKRRIEQPMFPGLVFVQLAKPEWHKVLAIPFVTGVFSPYGEPYRFLAEDMAVLGQMHKRPAAMPYGAGDKVRFVSGPMLEVDFSVADVDFRKGEVKLLADVMGRIAEIRARASEVRKAG